MSLGLALVLAMTEWSAMSGKSAMAEVVLAPAVAARVVEIEIEI
jgi:hypothetical protein